MSLTTIPITFYLSFEQPAGVNIVPQIVGGLEDTWRYTAASGGGDRSVVFNPRVSNAHDAAQVAPQPEIAHASVETNATGFRPAQITARRRATDLLPPAARTGSR